MTREDLLDDFAIQSFRDTADEDYIAARVAYRIGLAYPSLWQSQQTIEKYLKCILLLQRIPAKKVMHSLAGALAAIEGSGKLGLGLKQTSLDFIAHIDEVGEFRYREVSTVASSKDLLRLDLVVWELRRFCTLDPKAATLVLTQGKVASRYELDGGLLETIAASKENAAHASLLWNNGFVGRRLRRKIRTRPWVKMRNAPLYMHPEILDEVLKYVYLPTRLVGGWRPHKAPFYEVPEA